MNGVSTVFICINNPGVRHFSKGGGGERETRLFQIKKPLESVGAMGNNEILYN